MKCARCDSKKPIKAVKINFDYSEKSGIRGCLISASKYTCKKCGNQVVGLGSNEEVNQAIAEVLIGAEMLTRQMIKFIRVQYFDESPFQFAKRMSVNPSVYSEIENYKRPMSQLVSDLVQEQLVKKMIKKPPIKIVFS